MATLKLRDMADEQLLYFFELWARGRKNVDEVKAELLRRLSPWQPIETAPKDGRHIQAADFSGKGCGFGGNPQQSYQCVVHWWNAEGEQGWYPSTGAGENPALTNLTHWRELEELAIT